MSPNHDCQAVGIRAQMNVRGGPGSWSELRIANRWAPWGRLAAIKLDNQG